MAKKAKAKPKAGRKSGIISKDLQAATELIGALDKRVKRLEDYLGPEMDKAASEAGNAAPPDGPAH